MVRQCQVCGKLDSVHPELSFHRFPVDPERRKLWFSLVGFNNIQHLPKHPEICSEHFHPSDIIMKQNGLRYVKSGADPEPTDSFSQSTEYSSDSTIDETLPRKSHVHTPTTPVNTSSQQPLEPKAERTSRFCDNANVAEISIEDMEIKDEPLKVEVVDDEETISIPELRLKCRTCMESVPNTAVSVMAMYFRSKSVKDAISQLIPQLMPYIQDQDVVCNKCLKSLEETLLFIQKSLIVNKLLVEEEIVLRNKNNRDSRDYCPPRNDAGPSRSDAGPSRSDVTFPAATIDTVTLPASPNGLDYCPRENKAEPLKSAVTLPAANIDRIILPAVPNDPPNEPCCSDEECGNNCEDVDSDDYIKVVDSDLEDWVDVSDDDIELFSDSSTDVVDFEKQIEPSDQSKLVKKLRRINFSSFDNSDVEDNNSILAVSSVKQSTASKLIFGLEKIGVKVLSNLDKPDLNTSFNKKRILLIGNETVKYCPLCSEEMFLTEDKLVEHFNNAHNLSKSFLLEPKFRYEKGRSVARKVFHCPYCDEIVGEKQLGIHTERQHGDSKPYKCYKCKKEYRRYKELSSHYCFSKIAPVKKKMKVKEKRKCGVCKEKISLELYRVHFDSHKIFKCDKCLKRFTNSTSLTNHETLHHTKAELCPICGKIFNGVGLQLHMANHTDRKQRSKDFLCEFCPKSFSSNKNLRAHTKDVHLQNKVLCELCGEKCRASTLPAHIRLKHSKVAMYSCAICGEGFSRSDYFNRHVASHTKKRTYRRLSGGKNTPPKCKICSKQLTATNYYQHMNSHVTLKRFKCRFCNMNYNNYSNARRHEREHLKNPSYHIRCNICWKTFENNKDLNEHTDTHEKKYSCAECGMSFGRKFALSSHIAEEHTDDAEVEKKEELLRQNFGIGTRKRRRSKKKTIFDELSDLIKQPKIEVVQENEN